MTLSNIKVDRKEAEDFIYKSYLKAQQYQNYHVKDCNKRRNDLTYDLIRKKSHTPCVVVTGSKGKGSVANMISQILQAEYTVGLMTSPHIVDFCERFRVNGGKISDEDFVKKVLLIKDEIEKIDVSLPQNVCISPMGIQAYLALNYFEDKGTEFNIFECGKGAKYDDVNNIKHDYAVINSIFLEHTRELGETIEEIAKDKAHVITEKSDNVADEVYEMIENKVPAIMGEQKCVYVAEQIPSVMKVIQDRAEQFGVPLKIYGRDFWAENICYTKEGMKFDIVIEGEVYSDIRIPLLGEHQAKNCALAFALCKDVFEKLNLENEKSELKNFDLENEESELKDFDLENEESELKDFDLEKEKGELKDFDLEKEKDELKNFNLENKKDELKDFDLESGKRELSGSEFRNKRQRIEDRELLKIKENLFKINWPGRMEVISKSPFILLDACINGASCENVIKVLEHLEIEKASFIIGIPDDKDYVGVAKEVEGKASQIILTKSQNPHYIFTKRQQERLKKEGIDSIWTEGILEAIDLAFQKEEHIVILGTTSVIAEVKMLNL